MPVRRPQSYVRTCLPALFIKSHHHGRRTILLDGTRMLQEFIFPLLQGDGVDDGLALQAFQSMHNHFPLRESIMTGTRAISGSEAIRWRKVVIST